MRGSARFPEWRDSIGPNPDDAPLDFDELVALLYETLRPFPDARLAVATALYEMAQKRRPACNGSGTDDAPGRGAEPIDIRTRSPRIPPG